MSPWRLWAAVVAPFGLGYFMSYLLRAVNAVVVGDLERDVGVSAEGLGLITAAYLFGFGAFQLPLGVLLDRFGPRRVQACLLMVSAVGSLLFAAGGSAEALVAARLLIGLGFAGGLMASFKAVVLWAPPQRVPLFNALVMVFGGFGVLAATEPAHMAVAAWGWRIVFVGLGGAVALAASAIFLLAPRERPGMLSAGGFRAQLSGIAHVYRDRLFWSLAPLIAGTCGTHIALQTLWAAPWLRDVGGLDPQQVASTLFVMAAAFIVGILLSGALGDWANRRDVSLMTVVEAVTAVFLASLLAILLGLWPPATAFWAVFAMTGQMAILAYAHLSAHFGSVLAGRANTALNLLVFLGAFVIQYAVGGVLDFWTAEEGRYPEEAYRAAFGGLLAFQLLGWVWYRLSRPPETAGKGT